MKKINLLLLGCLWLFLYNQVYSQNVQWIINNNFGVSAIEFNYDESAISSLEDYEFCLPFSWKYAGIVHIRLNDNYFIETGLGYLLLKNKEKKGYNQSVFEDGELITGNIQSIEYSQTSNFSIPLALNIKRDNFYLSMGMQALYLLEGKYRHTFRYSGNLYEGVSDSREYGELKLKRFDYGALVVVYSKINHSLFINVELYYGLKNINLGENNNPLLDELDRKNRQLTFGLSYFL